MFALIPPLKDVGFPAHIVKEVKTNRITNEVYVYFEPEHVLPEQIEGVVKKLGYKAIRTGKV